MSFDDSGLSNPEGNAWLNNYYADFSRKFCPSSSGQQGDFWDIWINAVRNEHTGSISDFEKKNKKNGQYGYWVREYNSSGFIRFPNGLGGYGLIPNIEVTDRFVAYDPQSGEGGEHGESAFLEGVGVAGYVSHGMIGSAAELTAKTPVKLGTLTKSAAQLTRESEALWGEVAFRFNVAGGAMGAGVNGIKAYDNYSNGNYGWAGFHGSVALSYTIGIGLTILCPECGVGEYILISTMAGDIAGEGVKAINGH